ncbi:MAG: hypothetical protein KBT00_01025 [Bacteroidales bacterium]|nr:hypothetical protein [Candidatus Cacconaster merdequi]
MKLFILIIAAFLSNLFCDRGVRCEDSQCGSVGTVVESKGQDQNNNIPDYKSFGILPTRTAGYTGENNSITSSVRSTNSGRRVQPSGKAPFRVIKDGKVIDRHNFYTFQTDLKQFSSGIHSSIRYIYSICQLLI